MSDKQPCGHDIKHVQEADYGTYCDQCLPDGSTETYVVYNTAQFTKNRPGYAVASVPKSLMGKVAVTPVAVLEDAIEMADGLNAESWVIHGDGEIAYHKEHS